MDGLTRIVRLDAPRIQRICNDMCFSVRMSNVKSSAQHGTRNTAVTVCRSDIDKSRVAPEGPSPRIKPQVS